jgi:sugar transferase (PEP-CTERM system associated)
MATVFGLRVTWRLAVLVMAESLLVLCALEGAVCLLGHPLDSALLFPRAALIAAVTQLSLYYAKLYDFRVVADRRELFVRVLQALGSTSLFMAALYFLFPGLVIGRGVAVVALVLMIVLLIGWRVSFGWAAARLGRRERLLLVGTGPATLSLARELHERKELGVQITGFIDPDPSRLGSPVLNPGVIGTLEDLPPIIKARGVDRVVVSLADARGKLPMERLLKMKLDGVKFDHLASVYEEYTGKIALENLRPSWLIFSQGFRKSLALQTAKRCIDIGAASVGLVLAAPVMLAVALSVKFTSRGPIIYHQERVGRHGVPFTLYKFRSMRVDAEAETGPVWAREGDDRVTSIGDFIRRSRFDELPQLWNVLNGDMSLVGPRPERPEFVQHLTRQIPFYGQRHVVKPGVTGWAQVRYKYGGSVDETMEKLQYDLFYIKNLSLALDLFIIFKTIQTVIVERGT